MDALRQHVVNLLRGGSAHATLEQALEELSFATAGKRARGLRHSPWELLEHIRIAQWDILEFTRNPKHVSPAWPEAYWPNAPEPPSREALEESVAQARADHRAMIALVSDAKHDLLAPLPHDAHKTILREALLLADHNAYHVGQLVLARRALGDWKNG